MRHRFSLTSALLSLALAVFLTGGCANPGPPRPPSLQLPALPSSLNAERVGNDVFLSWITPANTTDGQSIRELGARKSSMTASVCRELQAPHPGAPIPRASNPSCTPVLLLPVVPGVTHATDALAPSLTIGPITPLSYRVEILNSRNHSAGLSDPVLTLAGSAPGPLGPLTIVSRRDGALLTWPNEQPGQSPSGATPTVSSALPSNAVEITRTLLSNSVSAPAAAPSSPSPVRRKPHRPSASMPSQTSAQASSSQTLILRSERLENSSVPSSDAKKLSPHGLIDRTVNDLETYNYTAQRVLSVSIAGRTLELRGLASPASTFTFHNDFPPRPPSGLVSVPSAGSATKTYIDLSWEPNPESDLLGYNIYRSEAGPPRNPNTTSTPSFTRLNPEPVPNLAFRDLTPLPGHAYLYTVTAIDRRHHESPPSTSVRETLSAEPPGPGVPASLKR